MEFEFIPKTFHANAERASFEEVKSDYAMIVDGGVVQPLLDAMQMAVAVLNEKRQIVFANRSFLSFLEEADLASVLGFRFGEVAGCAHATKTPGGCGTREDCRLCGIVNAVVAGLTGKPDSQDITLPVVRAAREETLQFRFSTAHLPAHGRNFVLLSVGYPGTRAG